METLQDFVNGSEFQRKQTVRSYSAREHFVKNIRECEDANLLADVRRKLWGLDKEYPGDSIREIAEARRQAIERGISESFSPPVDVNYREIGTFTDDEVSWEIISELYSCSIEELEDFAYFVQKETCKLRPELFRVLHGMCFYKTGDLDFIRASYDFTNRGAGLSPDEQVSRLADVFESIDPVVGSLLFGYIEKITANRTDSSSRYGSAKNDGKWLNIISDEKAGGMSTVAHEVGHSLQYAFGISCDPSIDNDGSRDELNPEIVQEDTSNMYGEMFRREMKHIWEMFLENDVKAVRDYQKTNFNEFFACAFEYWIAARDELPVEYTVFFNKHVS